MRVVAWNNSNNTLVLESRVPVNIPVLMIRDDEGCWKIDLEGHTVYVRSAQESITIWPGDNVKIVVTLPT